MPIIRGFTARPTSIKSPHRSAITSSGGSLSVNATTRSTGAGGQRRQARLSGLLAQQPSHAFAHEPLLPAPHTGFRNPGAPHDLYRATALRRRQNDPRPPDMLLKTIPIRHYRCQSLAQSGSPEEPSIANPTRHQRSTQIQRAMAACTGCMMDLTTQSPIFCPISVPTTVENR